LDVDIQLRTWQYIPKDSKLYTRHCENLKSDTLYLSGEATLVDIQIRTQQYIPEDSELYTRCSENLKSHKLGSVLHAAGYFSQIFKYFHCLKSHKYNILHTAVVFLKEPVSAKFMHVSAMVQAFLKKIIKPMQNDT
jgi:hypothetical protein